MKKTINRMVWGEDPQFSGPRDWFRNSLILSEVKRNITNGLVLDFGCGSGHLVSRFSNLKYKCTGVDLSPMAISYASQTYPNVSFCKGGLKYLEITKNKYDVVVSGEVIEHIKNDSKLVRGFFRILKANGIVVISTPAHTHYWDINDDFSSHHRRYEIWSLKKLFESNGFKEIKSFYWGWPLVFLWHRYIYIPMIANKIRLKKKYTGSKGVLGSILKNTKLKALVSYLFFFDQLFNWTRLGGGIIGVYRKVV